MKVALVQMFPNFLEKEENFLKMKHFYEKADSDLVLFPELILSGYNFNNQSEAMKCAIDEKDRIIDYFMEETLKRNNAIVFGAAVKRKGKLYNSQIFISGEKITVYDKVNLFNRENLFFEPGNEIRIVTFKGYKLGMSVCFDWFHPEFFRSIAKKGADLIMHSANLVMPYCQNANITRSLENRIFIATSNRIGKERDLYFTGMSQITDPFGNVVLKLGEEIEGVFEVELDLEVSRNKKLNDFNYVI
jgi:predicted amidohydrolase